jgi:hypothetical protein
MGLYKFMTSKCGSMLSNLVARGTYEKLLYHALRDARVFSERPARVHFYRGLTPLDFSISSALTVELQCSSE